jgi:hypothetical protein
MKLLQTNHPDCVLISCISCKERIITLQIYTPLAWNLQSTGLLSMKSPDYEAPHCLFHFCCVQIFSAPSSQTPSVLKTPSIFWDITPCSPLSVNRRCGGIYRLHLQGRRNQPESRWQGGVVPTRRVTFSGLHSVISQKIELFITTAARTSNPTTSVFLTLRLSFNQN